MISSGHSFRLLSIKKTKAAHPEQRPSTENQAKNVESDSRKRAFLKVAGMAGVGALATTLLPRKADALVFGSDPTTGVVGLKDGSNNRINPATSDIQTSLLTELQLKARKTDVQPVSIGSTVNVAVTSGAIVSGVVGISDNNSNRINPVQDDTVILLRRMVKLMESQATVDSANRQRITVDSFSLTATLMGTGTSASCPRVAIGSDSTLGTVTTVSNVTTIGLYPAQQMFSDVAQDVYANALRRSLVFV